MGQVNFKPQISKKMNLNHSNLGRSRGPHWSYRKLPCWWISPL